MARRGRPRLGYWDGPRGGRRGGPGEGAGLPLAHMPTCPAFHLSSTAVNGTGPGAGLGWESPLYLVLAVTLTGLVNLPASLRGRASVEGGYDDTNSLAVVF